MLTVVKSLKFDAAHILTNHQGQCRNLHGHTYRVEVCVAQSPDSNADMVIDFKDLKRVCEEEILSRCDHAFIYDTSSAVESEIAEVLHRHGMRTLSLPYRSTAENLATHFFGLLERRVPGLGAVRVWETPDSFAEYRR